MDEIRICTNDYYQHHLSINESRAVIIEQANNLFNQARGSAVVEKLKKALLFHSPELMDLENVPPKSIRGRHYGGIQGINIADIRGTMGRINDFDHHFHPLSDRCRERWNSIAIARKMNIPLKPVELIQIRNVYFVKDGHHRVSVAKALGETFIDAEIVVWDVVGVLPWEKADQAREFSHVM